MKSLAVSLGAIGLVLAGTLGNSGAPEAAAAPRPAATEFGGVSAQTASRAGTVDQGTAWYTLGVNGLRREIATR